MSITRRSLAVAALVLIAAAGLAACAPSTPADQAQQAVTTYADRFVAGDAAANEAAACEDAVLSYPGVKGGEVDEVGTVVRDDRYDTDDAEGYRSTVSFKDAELSTVDVIVQVSAKGACIYSVGT